MTGNDRGVGYKGDVGGQLYTCIKIVLNGNEMNDGTP